MTITDARLAISEVAEATGLSSSQLATLGALEAPAGDRYADIRPRAGRGTSASENAGDLPR